MSCINRFSQYCGFAPGFQPVGCASTIQKVCACLPSDIKDRLKNDSFLLLAKEADFQVESRRNTVVVHTPVLYPNGDRLSVVVTMEDDKLYVSDAGEVFTQLAYIQHHEISDIDPANFGFETLVKYELQDSKPAYCEGEFQIRSTPDNFAECFMQFVSQLGHLIKSVDER